MIPKQMNVHGCRYFEWHKDTRYTDSHLVISESQRLTKLVEQLGIMKQIRGKVAKQRGEMQRQKDQLKKEMEGEGSHFVHVHWTVGPQKIHPIGQSFIHGQFMSAFRHFIRLANFPFQIEESKNQPFYWSLAQ